MYITRSVELLPFPQLFEAGNAILPYQYMRSEHKTTHLLPQQASSCLLSKIVVEKGIRRIF